MPMATVILIYHSASQVLQKSCMSAEQTHLVVEKWNLCYFIKQPQKSSLFPQNQQRGWGGVARTSLLARWPLMLWAVPPQGEDDLSPVTHSTEQQKSQGPRGTQRRLNTPQMRVFCWDMGNLNVPVWIRGSDDNWMTNPSLDSGILVRNRKVSFIKFMILK